MNRHLKLLAPSLLALAVIALTAPPAPACIHLPAEYEGSHEQTSQGGLILWNHGRQELILKPSVRFIPPAGAPSDGNLPAALAWVIPLPSVPDAYAEADPEVFRAVHEAHHEARMARQQPRSSGGPEAIELLAPAQAGAYAIQPIETRGPEAGPALNAWLTANGFSAVPTENMAYYLERNWVWLAVKADLSGDSADVPLKPLHVSFASERIVYPLKFSSHQGTFDLTLWVVTQNPLGDFSGKPERISAAGKDHLIRSLGLHGYGFLSDGRLPEELERLQERASEHGFAPLTGEVVLTKIVGRINGPENRIADWPEDLSLTPNPADVAPQETAQDSEQDSGAESPAGAPPGDAPGQEASGGGCVLSVPGGQTTPAALGLLLLAGGLLGLQARRRAARPRA